MGASMVAVAAALLFVIALPVSADAQLRPPQSMSAEVEAARFRLRLDKETLERATVRGLRSPATAFRDCRLPRQGSVPFFQYNQ